MIAELKEKLRILELEIREAFRGTSRAGGPSWSESEVIDLYGTSEERRAARAKDTEKNWTSLVDDRSWHDDPGVGGFAFLNESSCQYYLAPAMIRAARQGTGGYLSFWLVDGGAMGPSMRRWGALTDRQHDCVIKFAEYMSWVAIAYCNDRALETWEAIRDRWMRVKAEKQKAAKGRSSE